jgi:hypothetical protein
MLLATPFLGRFFFLYVILPVIAVSHQLGIERVKLVIGNLIFWPVAFFVLVCGIALVRSIPDWVAGYHAAHPAPAPVTEVVEDSPANDPNWFLERKWELHDHRH